MKDPTASPPAAPHPIRIAIIIALAHGINDAYAT